ncbi:hypothetical protein HYV70_03795 [Candidatus Uhrbacteria bacterium]|nr:hypothetical protein [Candidatus Uhrbacteria bacterium]
MNRDEVSFEIEMTISLTKPVSGSEIISAFETLVAGLRDGRVFKRRKYLDDAVFTELGCQDEYGVNSVILQVMKKNNDLTPYIAPTGFYHFMIVSWSSEMMVRATKNRGVCYATTPANESAAVAGVRSFRDKLKVALERK